jgi:hypothetical protein
MSPAPSPAQQGPPANLRLRWLILLGTVAAPIPLGIFFPWAVLAFVGIAFPLQITAAALVGRALSARSSARLGWTVLLMLAALLVEAAAAFIWMVNFGKR